MKQPARIIVAVAVAVAVTAAAAFLAQTTGATTSTKPIIIGAVVDQSGVMSVFDNPALEAARLEARKITGHGGRKVEIISCNTQGSKPDVAKACVSNLISKGAVIGWVTGDIDFATPAVTEFLNKGLLTVSPYLGTDQLGPKRFGAKGRLAFSFGNVAQDEGAAMAEYAYKR